MAEAEDNDITGMVETLRERAFSEGRELGRREALADARVGLGGMLRLAEDTLAALTSTGSAATRYLDGQKGAIENAIKLCEDMATRGDGWSPS